MSQGLTKQCWSCDNRTDYDTGWCGECLGAMPSDVRSILYMPAPESYAGPIRQAIADVLRLQRRPRAVPVKPTRRAPLRLEDLGL